jgi:hypothetical protein
MRRNLDFDPFNLPQDVLEAVGLITSASSHTEYVVEQGIAGCAGLDIECGAAITTHMTSPHRDNVLRALAEIRIDSLDDLDELDNLLDHVFKTLKLRNDYVHNSLCVDKNTGEILATRTEARGSVAVELFPVSVNEIKDSAKRIYLAGIDLYRFLRARGLLPRIPTSARPRFHKTKAERTKRRKAMLKDC